MYYTRRKVTYFDKWNIHKIYKIKYILVNDDQYCSINFHFLMRNVCKIPFGEIQKSLTRMLVIYQYCSRYKRKSIFLTDLCRFYLITWYDLMNPVFNPGMYWTWYMVEIWWNRFSIQISYWTICWTIIIWSVRKCQKVRFCLHELPRIEKERGNTFPAFEKHR